MECGSRKLFFSFCCLSHVKYLFLFAYFYYFFLFQFNSFIEIALFFFSANPLYMQCFWIWLPIILRRFFFYSNLKSKHFLLSCSVKFWSWDIYTDTCAICRNALHGPSIEYQVSRSNMSLVLQLFIFYTTKNK